jgi:hypothetical protein
MMDALLRGGATWLAATIIRGVSSISVRTVIFDSTSDSFSTVRLLRLI